VVGVGAGVGVEVMSRESEVDDEGRPETKEGKLMYVVLFGR